MANKKSKQQKISKKELRRQQIAREKRQRLLRIVLVVVVVFLIFGSILVFRALQPEVEGVVFTRGLAGGRHDPNVTAPPGGLPPVGGSHSPGTINCDVYSRPVDVGSALHALEHGGVWITYHPDLAQEEVATLQEITRSEFSVLLSPYPDQASPIVVTSWGTQLQLDSADDERIPEFINRYRDRSPEGGIGC